MRSIPTIFFFAITSLAFSQNASKNNYGISFGIVRGLPIKDASLDAPYSYSGKTSFELRVNYYRILGTHSYFESGVSWHESKARLVPRWWNNNQTVNINKVKLLSVPIFVRLNLNRSFFVGGGIIGDLDLSKRSVISDQTGIGLGINLGWEISLMRKCLLQICPYSISHGLILLKNEKNADRILEIGIRFGVRTNL
jgi:hypothetical protein